MEQLTLNEGFNYHGQPLVTFDFILKNRDILMSLKLKVYNSCILPVTIYGLGGTMALTRKAADQLNITGHARNRCERLGSK